MNTRRRGARRPAQAAVALMLGLTSQAALALGLGDIRVLSQPGQPLVAEIPVISADPGELEAARVALASPATFARVGLSPPAGLVSDLRFALAQDAAGRAVIRVTSAQPVQTSAVSFLVEVDWGRGRLVREYSALVDRPQSLQAAQLPQIAAPAAAPSNTIVRPVPPALPPVAESLVAGEAAPSAAAPAASGNPVAEAPVRPVPVARPVAEVDAASSVVVARGQTLSHIAAQLAQTNGVSLNQAMVGLLQSNPHAFVDGSMHRLRAGARLELPDAAVLAAVSQAQARSVVREQNAQWQQARQGGAAAVDPAASAVTGASDEPAPAARGARLEIAPAAVVDHTAKAVESGTEAGAQGDMQVSEQLRQAREDLVTRDAEIAELRERVAELETLREQQQALIELKNNEMASAEKQLSERPQESANGGTWLWGGGLLLICAAVLAWLARRRKPSPLPPLTASGTGPDGGVAGDRITPSQKTPDVAIETLLPPWARVAVPAEEDDKEAVEESVGRVLEAESVPASVDGVAQMPDAPGEGAVVEMLPEAANAALDGPEAIRVMEAEPSLSGEPEAVQVFELSPEVAVVSAAAVVEPLAEAPQLTLELAPAAETSEVLMEPAVDSLLQAALEPLQDERQSDLDREADEAVVVGPWGVNIEEVNALELMPGLRERLELAIAYLDLGDPDTARTLLEEVSAGPDASAREQARELLARLD